MQSFRIGNKNINVTLISRTFLEQAMQILWGSNFEHSVDCCASHVLQGEGAHGAYIYKCNSWDLKRLSCDFLMTLINVLVPLSMELQ